MDKKDIEKKIIKISAEQLGMSDGDIQASMSFTDDMNADSLDIVELIMRMEEEFDLEIPDDDAEKIQTVNNAVEYIVGRLND